MKFFVYVLLSSSRKRTYSGQTDDVESRFALHNAGRVKSTKPYRPWVMIHQQGYETRAEAMQQEKWLKTKQGRKFIAELVRKWNEGR